MKKLMYLLVVGVMFAFTACGGGEATETACADDCAQECCAAEACADDCAKDCCAVEEAATHSHEDGTEHSHEGDEDGHTHDAVSEESADEESAE
ncbi:MAG: hypothetical protein HOA52_00980 [Flavobacteriales bacterium]|jgi:hypothetical protein|nr:hypothetical protein [Flavobacteriales bacterium]MBT6808046.1 hypothetical protein [Flavobacteriales bacterium]